MLDFDNDPHNEDDFDVEQALRGDIRWVTGVVEAARVLAEATGFQSHDAVRTYVEVRRELRSLVRLYQVLTGVDLRVRTS